MTCKYRGLRARRGLSARRGSGASGRGARRGSYVDRALVRGGDDRFVRPKPRAVEPLPRVVDLPLRLLKLDTVPVVHGERGAPPVVRRVPLGGARRARRGFGDFGAPGGAPLRSRPLRPLHGGRDSLLHRIDAGEQGFLVVVPGAHGMRRGEDRRSEPARAQAAPLVRGERGSALFVVELAFIRSRGAASVVRRGALRGGPFALRRPGRAARRRQRRGVARLLLRLLSFELGDVEPYRSVYGSTMATLEAA